MNKVREIWSRGGQAVGKRVGIFCGSASFAAAKLREGFDLVTLTPDLAMLTAAARAEVANARQGLQH